MDVWLSVSQVIVIERDTDILVDDDQSDGGKCWGCGHERMDEELGPLSCHARLAAHGNGSQPSSSTPRSHDTVILRTLLHQSSSSFASLALSRRLMISEHAW